MGIRGSFGGEGTLKGGGHGEARTFSVLCQRGRRVAGKDTK